jgi:cobalt ECF transporter T component CbiQ
MSAGSHGSGSFLEHLIHDLARTSEQVFLAEEVARRNGILQRLDPRVKVTGVLGLILAATSATKVVVVGSLFVLSALLAAVCQLPMWILVSRIWIGSLLFTGFIAVPAIFTTPGPPVFRFPNVDFPAATLPGLTTAALLLLRVETTSTLSFVLVLTTPWMHLLKALRALKVPVVAVVLVSMTVRYIVLLLGTAQQMFESHRSRTVGVVDAASARRLVYNTAGVLLGKTMYMSNEVYLAMQARGFRGEVHILDEFRLTSRDVVALAVFLATAGAAFWIGR